MIVAKTIEAWISRVALKTIWPPAVRASGARRAFSRSLRKTF